MTMLLFTTKTARQEGGVHFCFLHSAIPPPRPHTQGSGVVRRIKEEEEEEEEEEECLFRRRRS